MIPLVPVKAKLRGRHGVPSALPAALIYVCAEIGGETLRVSCVSLTHCVTAGPIIITVAKEAICQRHFLLGRRREANESARPYTGVGRGVTPHHAGDPKIVSAAKYSEQLIVSNVCAQPVARRVQRERRLSSHGTWLGTAV